LSDATWFSVPIDEGIMHIIITIVNNNAHAMCRLIVPPPCSTVLNVLVGTFWTISNQLQIIYKSFDLIFHKRHLQSRFFDLKHT
jgi:hypothetical protein